MYCTSNSHLAIGDLTKGGSWWWSPTSTKRDASLRGARERGRGI